MRTDHYFEISCTWQGNRGTGTSGYRDYGRELELTAVGKKPIAGSAAKAFHGDADRWNPEELLIAALAQCHMLSFLHTAVLYGVVVTDYRDGASGVMELDTDGGGQFTLVTLKPVVTIADPGQAGMMAELHNEAAEKCFIARSMNFPVLHEPVTVIADEEPR